MRYRDYFLTFESTTDEEAARIRELYFKMMEAIDNPDRIAYGTEHEKLDILNDDGEVVSIKYTGKVFHRIDVYRDELINRKKR